MGDLGSCVGVIFPPKQEVKGSLLLFVHHAFHGTAEGLLNAPADVRLPQTSKSVSASSLDNERSPVSCHRPFHPSGDLIFVVTDDSLSMKTVRDLTQERPSSIETEDAASPRP